MYNKCFKPKYFLNITVIFVSFFLFFSKNIFAIENTSTKTLLEDELYQKALNILDNYGGNTYSLYEAQGYLKRIVELNPNYALSYVGLARAEYKLGYINYDNYEPQNLESAHLYLNKALEIDPKLYEAHIAKGYVYLFQKDLANATNMAQAAENLKPNQAQTDILFAEIASKENNLVEAEKKARDVLNKTQEKRLRVTAHEVLGGIYRLRKDYKAAEETYLERIKLEPKSAWSKINYSSFLIKMGNYDKAIDYAKQALAQMDFGMGRHILAQAYYKKAYDLCWKQKNYKLAQNYFKLSLEQEADNPDAHYGLGVCYRFISYELKDKSLIDKSNESFKKAIELNPNHELAKKELQKNLDWVAGK